MAAFEGSYKSLLQGVSQQIPSARQDGQLTKQENMLSDTATNLRRRSGSSLLFNSPISGSASASRMLGWSAEVDGEQFHFVVDAVAGQLSVYNLAGSFVAGNSSAYYITSNISQIHYASVDGQVYVANTSVKPALGVSPIAGLPIPGRTGFLRVTAGAFSTSYKLTLVRPGSTTTLSYDTPDGTAVGHAAQASPSNIVLELKAVLDNPLNVALFGDITSVAYGDTLYLTTSASSLQVSTATGQLAVASEASTVRDESQLPPAMPPEAEGYTVRVGVGRAYRYYRWLTLQKAWLESAAYDQSPEITSTPIGVSRSGLSWSFQNTFEGRLAGDVDSNPDPEFLRRGVTGLASYQGRLVVLAGSRVCFSATNNPRRFYRSTVVDLLDADTISIGASAANSAKWQQAVQFGKDLLVFSEKYQAVVPGANTALTPRTASLTVFSTYTGDITTRPIPLGNTVLYPTVRGKAFYGVLEMAPTGNTESSYTSYDVTAHLPTYMRGRCRFAAAVTGGSMALFGTTSNMSEVIVHEYTWSGNDKVQQAWHRWTFPYPVASAYFADNLVVVLMVRNTRLVFLTIDPRAPVQDGVNFAAPLDVKTTQAVVAGTITPSLEYVLFAGASITDVVGCIASGPRASDKVQMTWDGTKWLVPDLEPGDVVTYGLPFLSTVEPTPPMKRDRNGVKVSSNKCTVLRFMLGTNASRQFDVTVTDGNTDDPYTLEHSPLYWSSDELQLGEAQVAGADAIVMVPCRTVADSTRLVVSTAGTGELNIVSLEYAMRYKEKLQRQAF